MCGDLNLFLFDYCEAISGLQLAFLYGLFFGVLFGLVRYMLLGVIERDEA